LKFIFIFFRWLFTSANGMNRMRKFMAQYDK
jgi:hypothetical protein